MGAWSNEDIEAFKSVPPIIVLDFDGTVVRHEYPAVGEELPQCVNTLKQYVLWGARLILDTMRSGPELDEAVAWFVDRNIPLWGVGKNPEQHTWTKSTKVHGSVSIDDRNLGVPLVYAHTLGVGGVPIPPAVDWAEVDDLMRKRFGSA